MAHCLFVRPLTRAERTGEAPILFSKRADGTEFAEFIQFAKDNGDGSRTTIIANEGGLDLLEAESVGLEPLASAVNDAMAKVAELSKRVDSFAAAQAELVELDPSEIVAMFTAAADEALLAAD